MIVMFMVRRFAGVRRPETCPQTTPIVVNLWLGIIEIGVSYNP